MTFWLEVVARFAFSLGDPTYQLWSFMMWDTAWAPLPRWAHCRSCGAFHHTPSWVCDGPLQSPISPGCRWYYRGADQNVWISQCRDCELSVRFALAWSHFNDEAVEALHAYEDRGGHLELAAEEFLPPLVTPARPEPVECLSPRVHPSVAALYPDERALESASCVPVKAPPASGFVPYAPVAMPRQVLFKAPPKAPPSVGE